MTPDQGELLSSSQVGPLPAHDGRLQVLTPSQLKDALLTRLAGSAEGQVDAPQNDGMPPCALPMLSLSLLKLAEQVLLFPFP